MKILNALALGVLSLGIMNANGQTDIPKGFSNGTITLADGTKQSGFVKDYIRKDASVTFVTTGSKKINYDGTDLLAADIAGTKYLCIKGDFFKVLCEGDLSFLQKSSDASGKVTYNGTEAIFLNGTDGKKDDYFVYNSNDKQLKLVSKKNVGDIAAKSFADCTAAMEKAKTINGDLSQFKGAVEEYNNRNR
jgi:hypothetical protein